MFCNSCGKELRDGSKFCPFCGSPLTQGVETRPAEQANSTVTDSAPKKPTAGKPLRIGIICVVIAALLGTIGVNALNGRLSGLVARMTKSDAGYMEYLNRRDADALLDVLAQTVADSSADGKVSEQLRLSLTDAGKEQFNRLYGSRLDLDWLDAAALNLSSNLRGEQDEINARLSLNGKDIVSGQFIADNVGEKFYISSEELLDTPVVLSPADLYGNSYVWNDIRITDPITSVLVPTWRSLGSVFAAGSSIVSKIPELLASPENRALLRQYLDLAFENITNVEKENTVLSVNGVTQKCTEYKAVIDAETIANVVRAVVEQAKTDKTLRALLTDSLQKTAEQLERLGMHYDIEQALDSFYDNLDMFKEEAESIAVGDSFDRTHKIEYSLYVTGGGQIIGRAFSYCEDGSDGFTVELKMPQSGNGFAFVFAVNELWYGDTSAIVSLRGSGKRSGSTVSGVFDLRAEDERVLSLEVQDADLAKLRKGKLSGTYTLVPLGAELVDALADPLGGDGYESLVRQLSLVVKLSGDTKDCSVRAELQKSGTALLSFEFSKQTAKSKKIVIPSKAVPAASVDSENLNLQTVRASLIRAGMPEVLAEELLREIG